MAQLSKRVYLRCAACGKLIDMPLSQFMRSSEHYCSRNCHLREMNATLNPIRMTEKTKAKLRIAHLGKNKKFGYTKFHGIAAHRFVAEKILGRKLEGGEVVHHIDQDKRNNSPENLMVFKSQAEHIKWHLAKGDLRR